MRPPPKTRPVTAEALVVETLGEPRRVPPTPPAATTTSVISTTEVSRLLDRAAAPLALPAPVHLPPARRPEPPIRAQPPPPTGRHPTSTPRSPAADTCGPRTTGPASIRSTCDTSLAGTP
ncbi:uncharacterized protein LOC128896538 [Hylaeus anthracinus]|uniref:uncharacterized protein LOC128896538 n=1 Tax=Hylaeus anthracinus TaxID=313031 RepID=UPI0023B970E0|nr:uncharacterized protein LOC128896538 [Hylaeus anthracinus]